MTCRKPATLRNASTIMICILQWSNPMHHDASPHNLATRKRSIWHNRNAFLSLYIVTKIFYRVIYTYILNLFPYGVSEILSFTRLSCDILFMELFFWWSSYTKNVGKEISHRILYETINLRPSWAMIILGNGVLPVILCTGQCLNFLCDLRTGDVAYPKWDVLTNNCNLIKLTHLQRYFDYHNLISLSKYLWNRDNFSY